MTIEQRVEELERQNLWMKRAVAVLFLACAAYVLLLRPREQGRSRGDLVARSLVLRDCRGKAEVKLGIVDGASFVQLKDNNGIARVSIECFEEGESGLFVRDLKEEVVVSVRTLGGDGTPWINMRCPSGKGSLMLAPAQLTLRDNKGIDRASLVTAGDGESYLRFYDAQRRDRAGLCMRREGSPRLYLADANRRVRAILGAAKEGDSESSLALWGENGKLIWQSPR